MRSVLLLLAVLSSACTLTMDYNQCTQDSDCPSPDGSPQFCSSDHICLANTPAERLCTQTLPVMPSPNAVHIGVLLNLQMVSGQPAEILPFKALQLGVDKINNAVELDGILPITLDICNVGTSPVDADNATRILIEQKNVVAIIGPNSASAATNMLARLKAAGVPAISPEIMDTTIANAATQGLFFRMAPVELEQGLQLVTTLYGLPGVMSTAQLGLLSVRNSYGNNIRSKFTTEWQRKDPNNNKTDNFFEYQEGNSQLLTVTSGTLVSAKPNFAVLIPGSDSVAAIKSLAGLPLDPKRLTAFDSTTQLLVTSSGRTADLLALASSAQASGDTATTNHLSRITGVAPLSFAFSQEGNDFTTSFTAANPGLSLAEDFMVGYTYDALFVLGAASAVVKGAQSAQQIVSFLRQLNGSSTMLSLRPTSFKETVQALAQSPNNPVSLVGVTGAIRFLANGGRDPVLLETWTLDTKAGKYVNTPTM